MAQGRKVLNNDEIRQIVNDEDIFDDSDDDEDFIPVSEKEIDDSDISSSESVESVLGDCTAQEANIQTYLSKDETVLWQNKPPVSSGRIPRYQILSHAPGPSKLAISRVTDIKSSLDLFLTQSLKQIVIEMTNIKGNDLFGKSWKNLDMIDMEAYLGLQILAGVYKSHGESLMNLWSENNGRPIFRATMSLEKFMNISRCLRFDSAGDRQERRERDKLAPIRNIWDKWNRQLKHFYHPNENVTIDEQLVPFRGRCSFRQYIPSKPAKYGLKIWALCDSKSKYAWNMEVYLGRQRNAQPEKNQGERVVLSLSESLPRGHTITCDNFFTTHNLAQQLLRRNITLVGTVRKNKTFLPAKIIDMKKKDVFHSEFLFTNDLTVVSYVPKKYKFVIALSSLHHSAAVSDEDKKKPDIILHYNETKAGVDALDQLVANYTCKRQTKRWPVALFSNIIDVSACNAYVIWTEINPSWNSNKLFKRRLFLEHLANQMIKPQILRREKLPYGASAKNVVKSIQQSNQSSEATSSQCNIERPGPSRKRQRCFFCPQTKNANKYSTVCNTCNHFVCKEHSSIVCKNCQ